MSHSERLQGEHASTTRMPGRPQSEELDRAILDATLEALSEVGFDALSIAAVARRAKTTPPAIYRRFTNKTKLLLAALEHDLATIATVVEDHGSLRADLIGWIRSINDALSPRRTRILACLTFQPATNREPIDLIHRTIHQLGSSQWSVIIRRAIGREELSHGEVPEVIGMLPGALATYLALLQNSSQDDGAIAQLVDTVMLPALFAAGQTGLAKP